MASNNSYIQNPVTGQTIHFLQTARDTNGRLLEMESSFGPFSKQPPAHYHPFQKEIFTIKEGVLTVQLNNEIKVYGAGEQFTVMPGEHHCMWNASDTRAVVNWKVMPALTTEYFLETVHRLAQDGKTNNEGVPSILYAALLASGYFSVFRLSSPPYIFQKLLLPLLGIVARWKGCRLPQADNSKLNNRA